MVVIESSLKKVLIFLKKYSDYYAVSLIIFIVGVIAFRLWNFDFGAPYFYERNDDLCHGMYIIRAMHGDLNVWTDSMSGYPYGANSYAFPLIPWMAVLWGYIAGVFSDNYSLGITGYTFLNFYLSSMCFYSMARRLNIDKCISTVGGIIYSFSYYMIYQSQGHETAVCAFIIPLVVLILINIYDYTAVKVSIREIVVVSIILSVSDPFYSFFACIMMAMAFVYSCVNSNKDGIKKSVISLLTISFSSILLIFPHIVYKHSHSITTAKRSAFSAWYFGLQLVSFIIPGTKKHFLSFLSNKYVNNGLPNYLCTYIGIWGIVGLVITILLGLKKNRKQAQLLLGILVELVIIGVSGGLGTAVALLITPQVRVYHRIYVYIYCLVILSLCLMLNKIFSIKIKSKILLYTLSALIVLFHLYDMGYITESTFSGKSYNSDSAERYYSDKAFSDQIKNIYPDKVKILYLPYYTFPEGVTDSGIGNYTGGVMLRLFNYNITTNFGAIYGSEEDECAKAKYDSDDVEHILSFAANEEYDAIFLDKKALSIESHLREDLIATLRENPIIESNDYALFPLDNSKLSKYESNLAAGFIFKKGFDIQEEGEGRIYRWADKECEIEILPSNNEIKNLTISFDVCSYGKPITIHISGCGVDEKIDISTEYTHKELDLDLSNDNKLILTSNEESADVGRKINFAISNWKFIKKQ